MEGLFHRTDNSNIISNDGPHLILSCVWRSISCPSFFQATLVICWTVAFLTRFRLGRQQLTPSQHNLPDTDNSFNNNSLLDVEKISNAILFIEMPQSNLEKGKKEIIKFVSVTEER